MMKKTVSLILAFVMCLSLCACSSTDKQTEPTKTELTKSNIEHYLAFTSNVDCKVETETGSIYGFYYKNYSGSATANIKVVNQSGAKFENVTITLKLYNVTFNANSEGIICGWEFTSGNHFEGSTLANAINYKTITITLPYDGNWSGTETLELALYTQWSDMITSPSKLSRLSYEIVKVTGNVIE